IRSRKVVEVAVDVLEVPCIRGRVDDQTDLRLGRNVTDVIADTFGQRLEALGIQQLEPVDEQVVVLARGNGWTPDLPALRTLAPVDRRAEEPDDDAPASHIREYISYLFG